jgi:BMFP domain-containing protein YqiC
MPAVSNDQATPETGSAPWRTVNQAANALRDAVRQTLTGVESELRRVGDSLAKLREVPRAEAARLSTTIHERITATREDMERRFEEEIVRRVHAVTPPSAAELDALEARIGALEAALDKDKDKDRDRDTGRRDAGATGHAAS